MSTSVPVGEVRLLGDRAFLIGVADAAAGRALAGELTTRLARWRRGRVRVRHRARARGGGRDGGLGRSGPPSTSACGAGPRSRRRPPGQSGAARHHPVPLRRARPRRGRRAGRVPRRRGGGAAHGTAADRSRDGVLARVRLPRGPAEPAGPGAPARAPAPGRAGRVGGHRQRPRRRLSDRVAGRLAPGRAHRLPPVQRGPSPVRRAGPGGPGAVHRGRCGRCRSSRKPVAAAAVVHAPRWPAPCSRSSRRGCAPSSRTAAAVASPPSGSRRRPGRSGLVRTGQPAGRQRRRRRHARAHGRRRPGCAASPRAMWPSSGPPPRSGSTARRNATASCCRSLRARCWRSAASAPAAAATWRWPAASSGPSGSGAAPPTS